MRKLVSIVTMMIIPYALSAQAGRSVAQVGKGVHFEQGLSWNEVRAKAKAEHKYIFVDCYATWCGPCKKMDEDVYNQKEVGDVYNQEFISVKLQMDQTAHDAKAVKTWYKTALQFEHDFSINEYPSFLYFDENGMPVHKAIGFTNSHDFIQLSKDAKNPKKQYYRILKNFEAGKIDTAQERGLARSLRNIDPNLSYKIALDYLKRIPKEQFVQLDTRKLIVLFQDNAEIAKMTAEYIRGLDTGAFSNDYNIEFVEALRKQKEIAIIAENYIQHLDEKQISLINNLNLIMDFADDTVVNQFAQQYINHLLGSKIDSVYLVYFIARFTKTSRDKGFDFFYHHEGQVDSIMNKTEKKFAQETVGEIIANEEMKPFLEASSKTGIAPDFNAISQTIIKKYNANYAEKVILNGKVQWYNYLVQQKNQHKYWQDLLQAQINKERYMWTRDTILTSALGHDINNTCYDVFKNSNDTAQLNLAVRWMPPVIELFSKTNISSVWTFIDTYACVLYKTGHIDEGVEWEQKAIDLLISQRKAPKEFIDRMAKKEEKMKAGEKIWLEDEYIDN